MVTTPATVTQFRENHNLIGNDGNGVKLAYSSALTAKIAPLVIDFGNRLTYFDALSDFGLDKYMPIRFLYITVKINDFLPRIRQRDGQISRDCRFTRAAFAACYGYFQLRFPR